MEEKKQNGFLKALGKAWSNYSFIFIFVVILIVYVTVLNSTGKPFGAGHMSAILAAQTTVIVGAMAIGMGFIIITGQIDLCVGSALVLVTGVTIMTFNATNSVILMLLAAIGSGLLCEFLNGCMIGFGQMPPFVATLGTQLIYRSITLTFVREVDPALSGSSSSQFAMVADNSNYNALRMIFGTGKLNLGIIELPYTTLIFLALMIIFVVVAVNTKYGKSVYAVGSNEKSARLAGINVTWVKISVYLIMGFLVGIAAFIQSCKIGNITPATSAKNYELYAIASVVLGGINMSGGRGKLIGVLFGCLSYTTINFIIVSIPSVSTDMQDACQGLVLIIVILIQTAAPIIKDKINTAKKQKANAKLTA